MDEPRNNLLAAFAHIRRVRDGELLDLRAYIHMDAKELDERREEYMPKLKEARIRALDPTRNMTDNEKKNFEAFKKRHSYTMKDIEDQRKRKEA